MAPSSSIAFLGLGAMGLSMARNLVAAGFDPALIDEVTAQLLANPPANPHPIEADGVRELLAAASAGQIPAPELSATEVGSNHGRAR